MIERILLLLKESKMTAKELTVLLDVNRSTVSEWKNGKIKPSTDHIIKIAKIFNVSADWLLGLSDDRTPRDLTPAEREAYGQAAAEFKIYEMTDEELAAKLPEDIREGMLALLRIERDKHNNN